MLSPEENKAIAQVGPGTPGGEWLRRYWLPISISDRWDGIKTLWQLDAPVCFRGESGTAASWGERLGTFGGQPTAVRILGEDLVLFRDGRGRPGLIGLRCPHRGASFEFGRICPDGIECCYHGWVFDTAGKCLAMPAEPADSTFKDKVQHTAYPVREMGGLLWTYMGPGEAPILPRLDIVAREDGVRAVENFCLWPANYFQICENSVDQAHTGILHAGKGGERSDIWGTERPEVSWQRVEFGIKSTQNRPGRGNYRASFYVFPVLNRLSQPWPGGGFRWPRYSGIWRTPVDDHNTLVFSVCFTPEIDGKRPELPEGLTYDITDQLHLHRVQDYQAIVSQGPIFDRSTERLGVSDAGVVLLRKLVLEGIKAVQRGEDPIGVWRTPDREGIIDLSGIAKDNLNVTAAA